MAEITLTVLGSAVGMVSSTLNLSAEDSDRLMSFLVANYGVDLLGNPRTPQGMIDAYWQAMAEGTIANVISWERAQAAAGAMNNVRPITIVRDTPDV